MIFAQSRRVEDAGILESEQRVVGVCVWFAFASVHKILFCLPLWFLLFALCIH